MPTYQDLSKEQLKILNLPLESSFLVTGPPGTGKTVMALYRAQMYEDTPYSSRLLMYNNTLKDYTLHATRDLEIGGEVETFYRWFWSAYKGWTGERPPQLEPFVYDWPKIMTRLVTDKPADRPVMLIDEGQDLPPDFYSALPLLSDHYTVLADENQRITETNATLDMIRTRTRIPEGRELRLTRNYRNTREIAELASCFYVGLPTGKPEPPERQGERPVVKRTTSARDAAAFIARFERTNAHMDIGILVPRDEDLTRLLELLREETTHNRVQYYRSAEKNNMDFSRPGIRLLCYASAKGLEFDTVFLPELQRLDANLGDDLTKMRLYVLTSRARDYLFLLYSGAEEPPLFRMIPTELCERRT